MKNLSATMVKLARQIEVLTEAIKRGKGAFGAAMLLVAAVSTIVCKAFDKFIN